MSELEIQLKKDLIKELSKKPLRVLEAFIIFSKEFSETEIVNISQSVKNPIIKAAIKAKLS